MPPLVHRRPPSMVQALVGAGSLFVPRHPHKTMHRAVSFYCVRVGRHLCQPAWRAVSGPSAIGMPRASILQVDRQREGAPVVGEAGGREGRRAEHACDVV